MIADPKQIRTAVHSLDSSDASVRAAHQLIMDFASRTGLVGTENTPKRYLWTDAYAVFALLGLNHRTGSAQYLDVALRLIDQVHTTLGRHRGDEPRQGWISGLSEEEGALRPTAGGLRIGKDYPERDIGDPYDEQSEWDRDGQYFHYLTKWIQALNRVSIVTSDPKYNEWAFDLALKANRSFVYTPGMVGPKSMYWKMSIDLTYPLVQSMGHLDPLDGLMTLEQIRLSIGQDHEHLDELEHDIDELHDICDNVHTFTTCDPLGIGELIYASAGLIRLTVLGIREPDPLLDKVVSAAEESLQSYTSQGSLNMPLSSRRAFREIGLSLCLQSVGPMLESVRNNSELFESGSNRNCIADKLTALDHYVSLQKEITAIWLSPDQQQNPSWTDDVDINSVMLATNLIPDAYLLPVAPELAWNPPALSSAAFKRFKG